MYKNRTVHGCCCRLYSWLLYDSVFFFSLSTRCFSIASQRVFYFILSLFFVIHVGFSTVFWAQHFIHRLSLHITSVHYLFDLVVFVLDSACACVSKEKENLDHDHCMANLFSSQPISILWLVPSTVKFLLLTKFGSIPARTSSHCRAFFSCSFPQLVSRLTSNNPFTPLWHANEHRHSQCWRTSLHRRFLFITHQVRRQRRMVFSFGLVFFCRRLSGNCN